MVGLVKNHLKGEHILRQGIMLELSGEMEAYRGKSQIPQSGLTFDLGHPRYEAGVWPTKPCHSIDVITFISKGTVILYINNT